MTRSRLRSGHSTALNRASSNSPASTCARRTWGTREMHACTHGSRTDTRPPCGYAPTADTRQPSGTPYRPAPPSRQGACDRRACDARHSQRTGRVVRRDIKPGRTRWHVRQRRTEASPGSWRIRRRSGQAAPRVVCRCDLVSRPSISTWPRHRESQTRRRHWNAIAESPSRVARSGERLRARLARRRPTGAPMHNARPNPQPPRVGG